jgi:hypothetical protein
MPFWTSACCSACGGLDRLSLVVAVAGGPAKAEAAAASANQMAANAAAVSFLKMHSPPQLGPPGDLPEAAERVDPKQPIVNQISVSAPSALRSRAMRILVATGLIGLAAAAAADASTPSLVGHVTLQAMHPNCGKAGCATPARSLVLRFRSAHGIVRSARTDPRGRFSLALAPGTYTVSTALTEDSPEAKIAPARVVIQRDRVSRIGFVYRPGR